MPTINQLLSIHQELPIESKEDPNMELRKVNNYAKKKKSREKKGFTRS